MRELSVQERMLRRKKQRNYRIMCILMNVELIAIIAMSIFLYHSMDGSKAMDRIINELVDAKEHIQAASEGDDVIEPASIQEETVMTGEYVEREIILVNWKNPMPDDYEPDLCEIQDGYMIDRQAAYALTQMLEDCTEAGLDPVICSAYRSVQRQRELYEEEVNEHIDEGYAYSEACDLAAREVAKPGTSEHALGLAVDIVSASYTELDTGQEETKEALWLKENCANYGFILRYPVGKTDITGIIYEPWHYRYVGVETAREIMSDGMCLEEYLNKL